MVPTRIGPDSDRLESDRSRCTYPDSDRLGSWRTRDTKMVVLMLVPRPRGLATGTVTRILARVPHVVISCDTLFLFNTGAGVPLAGERPERRHTKWGLGQRKRCCRPRCSGHGTSGRCGFLSRIGPTQVIFLESRRRYARARCILIWFCN